MNEKENDGCKNTTSKTLQSPRETDRWNPRQNTDMQADYCVPLPTHDRAEVESMSCK